jgi:BASS family bile acid:Na+ symporter
LKKERIFTYLIGAGLLCLLVVFILLLSGKIATAGPVLILFFALLGIGFRGFSQLKGFTYTTMIFAGVTAAMYYPDYFVSYNGYAYSNLITPLIQIIMFGMGTSMSVKDFAGVVLRFSFSMIEYGD